MDESTPRTRRSTGSSSRRETWEEGSAGGKPEKPYPGVGKHIVSSQKEQFSKQILRLRLGERGTRKKTYPSYGS